MGQQIARQRLYLTTDRKKLVGEGHKHAATLYAAVGDTIPASAAERFKLVDGALRGAAPVPETQTAPKAKAARKAKVGSKEKAPTPNKEKAPGEDKSAPSSPAAPAAEPSTGASADEPAGAAGASEPAAGGDTAGAQG